MVEEKKEDKRKWGVKELGSVVERTVRKVLLEVLLGASDSNLNLDLHINRLRPRQ